MINVRALANQAIQTVNPDTDIVLVRSTGYTTDANYRRQPTTVTQNVKGNVQGLSAKDLQHVDGLNIEGVLRSVHLYGNVQGVVRPNDAGGDVLRFPEVLGGPVRDWRVVSVLETWATWCRVVVALQNTPAPP
jgi:hypothetical protein